MQIGMGEKNSSPLTEYFLYATYFHHLTRVMFMANLWVRFYCFFSHLAEREIKAEWWSHLPEALQCTGSVPLLPCVIHISFHFLKIKVELTYHVVPISAIQHSDPVVHVFTFFFLLLSSIMFYPKRLDRVPCAKLHLHSLTRTAALFTRGKRGNNLSVHQWRNR